MRRLPVEGLIGTWSTSPTTSSTARYFGEMAGVPCHGKDAVRAWLQDWIDMFDGFWLELVELIDAGGVTVFTAERFGGRARSSGVETDQANWTVFTIRDGKIARLRIAFDSMELGRQLGLMPERGSRAERTMVTMQRAGARLRR